MRHKTEFSARPALYEIACVGAHSVIVTFSENIEEVQTEEASRWIADVYELETARTPDIEDRIESGYSTWLQCAKDLDYDRASAVVRAKRDELLSATDYIMRDDYPATTEYKQQIADYSNALRDVPGQVGFPYDIEWPQKPAAPQKVARTLTPTRVDNLEQSIDALVGGDF